MKDRRVKEVRRKGSRAYRYTNDRRKGQEIYTTWGQTIVVIVVLACLGLVFII